MLDSTSSIELPGRSRVEAQQNSTLLLKFDGSAEAQEPEVAVEVEVEVEAKAETAAESHAEHSRAAGFAWRRGALLR
ncbi:hypothetical protein [Sorangium sp. So ce1000]|uniref:hypothetical protein n=1 Tax=Sorangium sp. So ce1000 TaxID=3133325 RepID=UPI003F6309AD